MADWHRLEWQYRANRIAVAVMIVCCLASAEEVAFAFRYHFPLWDDVSFVVTNVLMLIARFVQKHTEIYRYDRN